MRSQKVKIQKLTEKGMTKLEKELEQFREKNNSNLYIDVKNYESTEIDNIEVDKNKKFDNKFSVGRYFLHIFPENFKPDIETWNWLSVFYYRQLLNIYGKIGELRRLFISSNYFYYPYRHLLKAPYDICRFYKSKDALNEIKFLLQDKVNANGIFYRQIAESQDILKNPTFIKVARRFFYNETTKTLKKDITNPIKRLIKVWKQYERSFDMYRMPSKEVIDKLLSKYDEFGVFIHG